MISLLKNGQNKAVARILLLRWNNLCYGPTMTRDDLLSSGHISIVLLHT